MAAFSAFRPYVQPDVPECPLVLVDDAIRDACRALSADTWLFHEDLVTFSTVVGTQSYVLSSAIAGVEVFGVSTIILNGSLPAILPGSYDASRRYAPVDGAASFFWFREGRLWFDARPLAVATVQVDALVRPTIAATTVDDRYVEYRDAISYWAKFKLMQMVGRPWSNPQDAQISYQFYSSLVGDQRIKDGSGRVARPLRTAAPFF